MSLLQQFSDSEQRVLRARAERVAGSLQSAPIEHTLTALRVRLGGETYALPIGSITAIYDNIRVVPVPGVPPYVAGIGNIRGHILPVLDLSAILNLAHSEEGDGSLVVIERGDWHVALRVERIDEVVMLPLDDLVPVPSTMPHPEYARGTDRSGTILLDTDAIFDDPALIIDETLER